MSFAPLSLIQVDDEKQNRFNQLTKQNLDQVAKVPFLDGVASSGITLTAGTNVINHGLGRAFQGYLLGQMNAAATVFNSTPATMDRAKSLQLTASATVTLDLWVY